jgi:hypothetical protein
MTPIDVASRAARVGAARAAGAHASTLITTRTEKEKRGRGFRAALVFADADAHLNGSHDPLAK